MTDGQGYYAYLPAIFVYQDLQFEFVKDIGERYYTEGKRANFVVPKNGGNVNKYFIGTAVIQAPFFGAGCLVAWMTGEPVDGYSKPFQLMVGIAAIFCLALGILFLGLLLCELGFQWTGTGWTLLLILLGTNLFYYAIYEPSMSHVYSFLAVCAFLYYARMALVDQSSRGLMLAALAFGLVILIRPVNGLVLIAAPALAGGIPDLVIALGAWQTRWKQVLVAFLIVFGIIGIQPIVYWLQTGDPMIWSYENEGFNFLSPRILDVLFSYRKGLFIYCPVLLLGVAGILAGTIQRKAGFGVLLFMLTIATWMISSWWMWSYGGSYGHRAFIDFYPVFAIGLAYLFSNRTNAVIRGAVKLFCLALIVIQMIQTYQYVHQIIPFDNMDRTKYWNLFLRTDEDLKWYYSGDAGEDTYITTNVFFHDMENRLGWGNEGRLAMDTCHNGNGGSVLYEKDEYGVTLRKRVEELYPWPDAVKVSAWIRSSSDTGDVSFVCAIEDSSGDNYFWSSRPLRPMFRTADEWVWVTALFRCGRPHVATDQFVVYPMKGDSSVIFIDDLQVCFLKTKEQ